MSYIYRGVCKIDDDKNQGELRPKGNFIEVEVTFDSSLRWDSDLTWNESEINTVLAHQNESGQYGGCFVSFTTDKSVAVKFATSNNMEEGYVYVVDEELLPKYGVVSKVVSTPEHPDESEVSLRAQNGGVLPAEIVVGKYKVMPK